MPSEDPVEENHHMGTRQNGEPRDSIHPRILKENLEEALGKTNSSDSPPSSQRDQRPGLALPPNGKSNKPPPPPSPKPNYDPPNGFDDSPTSPKPQTPPSESVPDSPPPPSQPPKNQRTIYIVIGAVIGFVGLISVTGILLWRRNKTTIQPRGIGLSGQLRKAFVSGNDRSDGVCSGKRSYVEGIPNLKRAELETACEEFSNVIGSSSMGTIYKGTLSNGVEVAVISVAVTSAKDWPRHLDSQFRKKIETLSKVNYKNFVNLIGYCEEETPFTRMMVFEYAPNGSLFEHLHVREAEHLDWGMRLRVAMGMAYCLEYMHQLVPPITHPNLNSSAVNLSEDYAAKISDFCFWNKVAAAQVQPIGIANLSTSVSPESNVYSYGLVLLEMMTGQIPLSEGDSSLKDWVSEYLRGDHPLQDRVDPLLRHYKPEQLEKISEVIKKCLNPEPQQRPTMRDVMMRFREITGIDQDKASPRPPLWWEELEIRSVNGG